MNSYTMIKVYREDYGEADSKENYHHSYHHFNISSVQMRDTYFHNIIIKLIHARNDLKADFRFNYISKRYM